MSRMPSRERKGQWRKSAEYRRRWADPEYRAKQAAGRERREADRKLRPQHYSRLGIPNGMRKPEAMALWAKADKLADAAMRGLEVIGTVSKAPVPDSDEDLARRTVLVLCKIVFGPVDDWTRILAGKLILRYTKPTLATQHEITESTPEDWLRAALVASV